jgi:hypothetical protein
MNSRGSHKHCIVGKLTELAVGATPAHDPHPDSTMLGGEPEWAGLFLALSLYSSTVRIQRVGQTETQEVLPQMVTSNFQH